MTPLTPPPRRARVLLIEDNPGDARLVQEALRAARVDLEVTRAADGTEGIAAMRSAHADHDPFDLLILDLNLPGMSGFDVLHTLKSDPELRTTPIIILSSSERAADIVRSYELQANGYVAKPIDPAQLFRALADIERFWFHVVRLPSQS